MSLGHKHVSSATSGGRYVACNHKTGTVMLRCLASVTQKHGITVHQISHSTGHWYNNSAHQLNMMRSPFVLVDSGHSYHMDCGEGWTHGSLSGGSGSATGAQTAYHSWKDWCEDPHFQIDGNKSYAQALNSLPLEEGMLYEALRALHRDVPFVVASTKACAEVGPAACTSLDLDVLMADYSAGWRDVVAPTLKLTECDIGKAKADAMHHDFVLQCDPYAGQAHVKKGHVTN